MSNCPCDKHEFPPKREIPAGLSTIARQTATFAEFRDALLAAIPDHSPLAAWRARSGSDFGIMLLEMWAYISDVLSFYDETIAHEAYLRAARLRDSVRKIAGLLGYLPLPAIAAQVVLAAIADGKVAATIPAGTAFRSGAFSGNPPQVFELDADTKIHPGFNSWQLEAVRPTEFTGSEVDAQKHLLFRSGTAALKRDDVVLRLAGGGGKVLKVVSSGAYTGKDGQSYTRIEFDRTTGLSAGVSVSGVRVLRPATFAGVVRTSDPFSAYGTGRTGVKMNGLYRQIRNGDYVLLRRLDEWRWFRVYAALEVQEQIAAGTTTTITNSDGSTSTITTPAVTAPVTCLALDTELNNANRSNLSSPAAWGFSDATITVHYALHEAGEVTVEAKTTLAACDPLRVKGPIALPRDAAAPGAFLLEDAAGRGIEVNATLDFTTGELAVQGSPFTGELQTPVTVYGNLLSATRGERVPAEDLGTGNSQINQSFKLKKKPLTYLSASSSTLSVYVDGVKWQEAASFFGAGSDARVYVVRQNNDGETTVTFGDGVRGSRLPTGANVTAYYRYGAGEASPPAGGITQLAKPAAGLRSVRNPVAASGGGDAEAADKIRTYAPRSALLLGRAVSMPDFQAAAAIQPGVRVASAEWRWNQERQQPVVQIHYIGGPDRAALLKALHDLADPSTPIDAAPAQPLTYSLSIDIETDEDYLEDNVLAEVRSVLLGRNAGLLTPEQLGIGKPLFRSRIFEAVLNVPGAKAVRDLSIGGIPFAAYAVTPGAGRYFDFEHGVVLLNGKAD